MPPLSEINRHEGTAKQDVCLPRPQLSIRPTDAYRHTFIHVTCTFSLYSKCGFLANQLPLDFDHCPQLTQVTHVKPQTCIKKIMNQRIV